MSENIGLKSQETLNTLRTSELFGHVPDGVLVSLRDRVELVQLPAGKTLFNKGESGDGLYLVVEGVLEILSDDVQLALRGPREYVGELALLDDSPRSATVRAKTDVRLLKLHRDDFHHILSTSPEVAAALLRLLGQKIKEDTLHRVAIVRQQEQLQYDLKRAHEIQTAMLPSEDLMLDWIHLAGKSQPAAVVGGDYYDYFHLSDGCVSLAIGDVVGHGFYSSLLVAIVSSTLRLQMEIDADPSSVIAALHKVVRNYRHTRMLMTFSYLEFFPADHAFTLINAGHPYPYLYREGQWTTLELDSLPLGTRIQEQPASIRVEWTPGDRLFLYSDGVVEAQNDKEEQYGFDALERFLYKHVSLSPEDMVSALYEELDRYGNGLPLEDDLTVVVVAFL